MSRPLRSRAWFEGLDRNRVLHRAWLRNQGIPDDLFDGRPVIGICNTWSELTPCNAHLRDLAEHVKTGVLESGGWPLEFPAMSLGEPLMRPTTMMFRNLAAMEVEEQIRANPLDGVVLLVGCDKTTPALVMGAASCGLPTILVSGGPMLNGKFRGADVGSGTSVWEFSEAVRAGDMSLADFMAAEEGMSRSAGHCMTMGTASTMAVLMEAVGLALPFNGSVPAVDAGRRRLARMSGRRIVELVREDVGIADIVTRGALMNALVAHAAVGGSTNAVVHLLAIAGRLNIDLSLADFDRIGRETPCLLNLRPSGAFLMEDFHYAGGLPALLAGIVDRLDPEALTVSGSTLAQGVRSAANYNSAVIRTADDPISAAGGVAVVSGNLAPGGAVIKVSAASPALLEHEGRAVVFDGSDDAHARLDDAGLEIEADDILVLRGCGPIGYPGFPEVGNLPLPSKLLARGVRDMVRLTDARMSGTAYGTVVLHIAPEAAVGGPLALVETGDRIRLSVAAGELTVLISDEELARRREKWTPAVADAPGYAGLYVRHVQQADRGADFDFLVGARGAAVPKESH